MTLTTFDSLGLLQSLGLADYIRKAWRMLDAYFFVLSPRCCSVLEIASGSVGVFVDFRIGDGLRVFKGFFPEQSALDLSILS